MVEYQIALIRNGSVNDIEARTSVMAADDVDALLKAKAWVMSVAGISEGAWLQLNREGHGWSLKPGEFRHFVPPDS